MNKQFRNLVLSAGMICGAASPLFAQAPAQPQPARMVQVSSCDTNGLVHFYAANNTLAPVTVTFETHLKNLRGSSPFPCTVTLAGNASNEVFTLAPIRADVPWNYNYTYSSIIGSATAIHDDSYVYSLPYATGSSFSVSQGYHGRFSHRGPEEYAIDWSMPVGTTVCAARDGLVVKCKDDSDVGGPSRKFETNANYVLIQHCDGTTAIYGHLQKGGIKVKVGDQVNAGDPIALSGETGFTRGPHLHFSVFKAKDGTQRESLPGKFRSANKGVVTLRNGQSYTAASPAKLTGASTHFASSK